MTTLIYTSAYRHIIAIPQFWRCQNYLCWFKFFI